MMDKVKYIINSLRSCGIELSDCQGQKLLTLYEFLVQYNENVNLTAITEFEQVVAKHFADSIMPFVGLEIENGSSFIDVGTGAGFPSLPLLVYRSDLKGTLLEALNKRCVYLEQACEKISVQASIVHGRAEDYAKTARESFDIATARAVAAMPVLAEYCLPFVKTGGRFIALKSVNEDTADSREAIKTLGGELENVTDYEILGGDKRRLVIVRKIRHTPPKFPRNPAMIRKKPL